MQLIKKISTRMYLIAGAIFFIFSAISLVTIKSSAIFISGLSLSLVCLLFQLIFKVKWNEMARNSLLEACESIKSFGSNLPLKFLGSLQFLWLFLLVLTFFKPLAIAFFPSLPELVFTMINNISFAFFILGSFYQLLQGKVKGIATSTGAFAVYNIVDVIYTFVMEEKVLSTNSMCLFIVFWSIHLIFSVILLDKAPETTAKNKEKKKEKENKKENKKEKKVKNKKTAEKEIEAENMAAIEDFEDKQAEKVENSEEN